MVNDVADDKKVPVFLSTVGGKIYSLLCDLLAPEKPQDQTMEQITTTLQRHFQPKLLVISKRFYFHKRNQLSNESITEYGRVKGMATQCEICNYLNDAL